MRILTCGLLFLAACGLTGCGGDAGRGDLAGEVTFDGKPLEQGSLLLTPVNTSKGTATGGEIKDGKYSLTGKQAPAVGTYKVEVRANKKSGKKVQKALGKPGELDDELVEAIAPRFNARSELTVEVQAGSNTKNFTVLSK